MVKQFWLLLFAAATVSAAEPFDTRDPQAWYRAARAEAEKIADPEQRHLIGQLTSASQKVTAEEADRQVRELRTKYAGVPGVAKWQIEEAAFRQYEALGFWRQAEAALREAIRGAKQAGIGAENAILGLLEDEPRSLASRAAAAQDFDAAWEIVERIEDPQQRKEAAISVCFQLADSDLAAAERALVKYAGADAPQTRRELILQKSRSTAPGVAERGLKLLIQEVPTMSNRDLANCYGYLQQTLEFAPAHCSPAILDQLAECFERTRRQKIDPTQRVREQGDAVDAVNRATESLIALRTAQNRLDDALALAAKIEPPNARQYHEKRIASALIRAGRWREAERLADDLYPQIAAEHNRAGRPREALAAARLIDDLREAYPLITAAAAKFLAPEDGAVLEQAFADLTFDDLRAHCFAELAPQVLERGQLARARAFLAQAEKLTASVPDESLRRSAGIATAFAYARIGAADQADALLKTYGDPKHFVERRLQTATAKLKARDPKAFHAAMDDVLKTLHASATFFGDPKRAEPAPLPSQSNLPRSRRQSQFSQSPLPYIPPVGAIAAQPSSRETDSDNLGIRFMYYMAARELFLQAGDSKRAKEAAVAAFAANSKLGGTFWRWEMYAHYFIGETPKREQLQELAEFATVADNPADRATLLAIGGAIANHFLEKPE